jgi:hypothetical protein
MFHPNIEGLGSTMLLILFLGVSAIVLGVLAGVTVGVIILCQWISDRWTRHSDERAKKSFRRKS